MSTPAFRIGDEVIVKVYSRDGWSPANRHGTYARITDETESNVYDFKVEWPDGTVEFVAKEDILHRSYPGIVYSVDPIPRALSVPTLRDISARHYAWLDSVGWTHQNTPLEFIGLIASELGEAADECRSGTPTAKLPAELADIILRTMGMAEELGIDIEAAVLAKMEANRARGTLGRLK